VAEWLARATSVYEVASSSPAGFARRSYFSQVHPFLLPLTGFHIYDDL